MLVNNKSKSFLSLAISLAIILLSLAVPVNMQISASAETYPTPPEGITVWNGNTEEIATAPDTNDYHVYTAEQLAYVLSTDQEWKSIYLENDIYLNDLSDFEIWDYMDPANNWIGNDSVSKFTHVSIYGNNHIIYGLFDYEEGGNAGLVHTNKTQGHLYFYNLGIDYAYISGRYASAFLATMDTGNDGWCNVTFQDCFVGENVKIIGTEGSGGFIGGYGWYSGIQTNGNINLTNCYSLATVTGDAGIKKGAFCGGTMCKNIKMEHCYTNQSTMFGYITPYWDGGQYGKVDPTVNYSPEALCQESYYYTTACTDEMMQGNYAAVQMTGLGSAYSVTDGYPVLACFDKNNEYKTFSEVQGELFAGGAGTEAEPFLISTKDNLKNMLNYFGGNNHYKLTNDIYVNYLDSFDLESGNAKDANNPPESWFAAASDNGYTNKIDGKVGIFNGTVDGDGYAVHGIRFPRQSQWGSDELYTFYAGFIPIMGNGAIKNLTIADSFMSVTNRDSNTAVIGTVAGKIKGTVDLSSIMIEDTVMNEVLRRGGGEYSTIHSGVVGIADADSTINFTDIGMYANIKDDNGLSAYASGLVSEHWNSTLTVTNCFTKNVAAFNKNNDVKAMTLTNVFSNAATKVTNPQASWNYGGTNVMSVVGDLTFATLTAAGFDSTNWVADDEGYPVLKCRVDALASREQVTITFMDGDNVINTFSSYLIDENGRPSTLPEVNVEEREGYVLAGWTPEYTVGAAWPTVDTVYTAVWDRIGFMGDINMDDSVDILDLVRLKKYSVGLTVDVDVNNALFVDFEGGSAPLVALRKYLLTGSWHTPGLFADEGYTFVWGDEFNADTLNSDKWQDEEAGTASDRISSNAENLTLDNNALNMRVHSVENEDGTFTYHTASGLKTLSTMNFNYGYLEMKLKAPVQGGVWPAVWLSGLNGPWSADFDKALTRDTFETYGTEVDILEQYQTADTFSTHLHKWYPGSRAVSSHNDSTYTFDGEYHIYGFKWTPEKMSVYVDGNLCYSADLTESFDEESGMEGFQSPHYLRIGNGISTAANGWEESPLTGAVDCTLSVDWIRLYQIPEQGGLWTK